MGKSVEITLYKGDKEGKIYKSNITKTVGDDEVCIRITHSGLCGTDEHYKCADRALGHEGCGIVEEVGSQVHRFKKGELVGWGYQHDCCGYCKQCLSGCETMCPERSLYGYHEPEQGSIASHAVRKAGFVFKIPEGMEPRHAAPLMCGGASVWNPLASWNVKPGDRVGILGVGGLGHLAIQFAAKMGCQVVVFSGTDSKKEEAFKLGATEFHATKGVEKLDVVKPIDALIVTTSAQPKWTLYLPAMAPNSTIFLLGVSAENMVVPYSAILAQQISLQGSVVAARHVHLDMLEFAALHNIKPIIEEFPLTVEGIERGFKKLEAGEMRYRGVFVAQ